MKKLLWIGDAACDSGFARCTHETLNVLRERWDVHVLGLNYRGDPHPYPYPIYPAYVPGGDLFGVHRVKEVAGKIEPDLIVIQNDPWNFTAYMNEIKMLAKRPAVAGAVAVDALNCRGSALNALNTVVFWTEFGRDEAIKGGCLVEDTHVIPLGVDLEVFNPGDKVQARKDLGYPEELCHQGIFVVGNVNRNQPRKKLEVVMQVFAEWIHSGAGIKNAYLYLHVAPTGDQGVDIEQLGKYLGINQPGFRRIILAQPEVFHGSTDEEVALTHRAMDVNLCASLGEGWGLTAMESMACGVVNILPNHSAFAEWASEGAVMVPCTANVVCAPRANTIGKLMNAEAARLHLGDIYADPGLRRTMVQKGWELVNNPKYRWRNIGLQFVEAFKRYE